MRVGIKLLKIKVTVNKNYKNIKKINI